MGSFCLGVFRLIDGSALRSSIITMGDVSRLGTTAMLAHRLTYLPTDRSLPQGRQYLRLYQRCQRTLLRPFRDFVGESGVEPREPFYSPLWGEGHAPLKFCAHTLLKHVKKVSAILDGRRSYALSCALQFQFTLMTISTHFSEQLNVAQIP